MIPSNQFWLNNGKAIYYPPKDYVYKSLLLSATGVYFKPRDGAGLVYYNSKLRLLGGWNPGQFAGQDTTNEQWESSDGGLTWTQLSNAGWARRHSFGYGVKDNKIWVWGGDYVLASYQKDVWTYDTINGWVQVTSDWGAGVGNRILFSFCIHREYLYVAGGQTDYTSGATYFTDIYKSSDGVTWTKAGDLPYTYFSAGTMVSDGVNLYIIGGGTYNETGSHPVNSDIYKSTDNGATWTLCGAYPAYNGTGGTPQTKSSYCNAYYFYGKIWLINGADTGVQNANGVWYSSDGGANWTLMYDRPDHRHATAVTSDGTNLFYVTGNLYNDVLRITPTDISSTIPSGYSMVYSLRKVVSSYSGNCIRVRRSSDNTEQDIGFLNGVLDSSALTSFVGANNGFIVTWYDQSGNARDFSQSTQAAQPRIVNAGTIETLNSKHAINVISGSQYLTLASNYNLGKTYSVFAALKWGASDIEFLGYNNANDNYMMYQGSNLVLMKAGIGGTVSLGQASGAVDLSSQSIVSIHRDNTTVQMYQNSKVITLTGDIYGLGNNFNLDQVPATPNENFTLNSSGGEGDPLYRFRGYLQEIIIYNSNKLSNKPAIERNMNSYYGTY